MQGRLQNPLDHQLATLTPTIALTCVATLIVVLRLFTRSRIVGKIGFDDWVIVLSLVLSWAVCGLTIGIVKGGIGGYAWTSQLDLSPSNARLVLAWNCLYMVLLDVTKASMLMQYLRIFSGRTMRVLNYCLLAALVPALVWGILGGVLLCDPVAKLWNPRMEGSCRSLKVYWLSTASLNIVLDFATVLLPLPAIWRLRMSVRQKIGLVLVFLLGFFVCGISLVRVALVHQANVRHDWTDASVDAFTWSTVEANTGIVCASVVALKPLIAKVFPNLFGRPGTGRHSNTLPTIHDDKNASENGRNGEKENWLRRLDSRFLYKSRRAASWGETMTRVDTGITGMSTRPVKSVQGRKRWSLWTDDISEDVADVGS